MPYDGTNYPTDVRNLLTLADALEREHEDFKWEFGTVYERHKCKTIGCAIGLAVQIGILAESDILSPLPYSERLYPNEAALGVQAAFGLTEDEAFDTFGSASKKRYGVQSIWDVTPAMVAARLREIAAEKMKARAEVS